MKLRQAFFDVDHCGRKVVCWCRPTWSN